MSRESLRQSRQSLRRSLKSPTAVQIKNDEIQNNGDEVRLYLTDFPRRFHAE
jgi:hypothetical protein